ncbi:dicarboxylate/amino acid:cation symporter [Dokdonella sp.]|jgi:Na+/H+-dicarboxylate symporter|uniref:dicarboxylate/amino acid:cation symporter n=1 Tax=Dokdonella sp. TaxID=2291710 RepID=UPI001B7B9E2D|nr:dicarboxylate/amino acid:cation symporter [Dokdonella sp.]MBP6325897.1 dicarboxylate/amino acid:cation symporter [Dokdonella sp.]MBP6328938.1 dicarboxylate/amino acid:cation symporter [Dokdonella sp.]HNV07410.1 dicarboxylate/amino acid:cation symporter [Dokdonella sp.]HPW03553.1 dicarboxylate/amino acid:cation symporter [Dokdonella sp.]HQV47978.1 dicarboxylate/amino acid:cation symporter [Dokdonella sp.]
MSTGTGMALHTKMLIGFVLGLGTGLAVHWSGAAHLAWVEWLMQWVTQPVGKIFLRLLFMLVIPLLFSALVVGIAEMGDLRSLGRVGWKTLAFTVCVSSIAVAIGITLVNLFKPGAGVDPAVAQQLLADASENAQKIVASSAMQGSGIDLLLNIVPTNVIRAAADNDILAVMFFALMFGIGIVLTRSPLAQKTKDVVEGVFEICMTLIHLVIRLAPYAVACLVFNLAAAFGWDLLTKLAGYVGVALLAMSIHFFIVYSLSVRWLGGMSPIAFFRGSQEAIVMAFSTASSNATLPTALKVADEELKLPRKVARFVLTVGATANQNGTALFEGVTVLFLAQFFNIDLSLTQQVVVMLVCILGGVGTAGVPAGSLPVIAMICGMVGVPAEGIGLILGVDRLLDMCRTTLNVTGDLAAAVVVSNGSGDSDGAASTQDQT